MSLIAHTNGEAPLLAEGEEASLVALLSGLLSANRLVPESLIAARIGLPSGEASRRILDEVGIRGIPVFWESRPLPRVELFVKLKRRRRLRSLELPGEAS